jgi:hypothetical protein
MSWAQKAMIAEREALANYSRLKDSRDRLEESTLPRDHCPGQTTPHTDAVFAAGEAYTQYVDARHQRQIAEANEAAAAAEATRAAEEQARQASLPKPRHIPGDFRASWLTPK